MNQLSDIVLLDAAVNSLFISDCQGREENPQPENNIVAYVYLRYYPPPKFLTFVRMVFPQAILGKISRFRRDASAQTLITFKEEG